jgi:hypothetical protein
MAEKGKYKKNMWIKIILVFISIVFTLFIASAIFIITQSERIINRNLSDFILQKTDSIYTLNFKDIDIDFKKNTFTITELKFNPRENLQADTLKKYYNFESEALVISKFRLLKIIREKRFIAESVKIDKPTFSLSSGEKINMSFFSSQKINKGDSLGLGSINEIKIDTILITDALMQVDSIFKSKHKVPKVNIEINDFKIGGIKQTDSPFPFDISDIALKIENLHNELSDNLHEIDIEEISFSIIHSVIKAKNITLSPKVNSTNKTDNRFTVKVPEVKLKSPYVEKFYNSDTIPITSLTLQNPDIKINFGGIVQKGTPLNEINFYKLVEKNFKWVRIDTFSITNANLELYPNKAKKPDQVISDCSICFYNFLADSDSYKEKDRILSSSNLCILINKYILYHSDRIHYLSINKINADTRINKVTTGYIAFKPFKSKQENKQNTLIDIKSNGLSFSGINFHELYHNKRLPMEELLVFSPVAKIRLSQNVNVVKKTEDSSLFLQKISDYLKGIYVEKTKIKGGKLNYGYSIVNEKTGFFDTSFDFELENLSLDSATFYRSDKIFFADGFQVSFSDISLQLADDFHNLFVDSVSLSSSGQSAEVFNMKVLPVYNIAAADSVLREHNEIIEIDFPKILLSGADLHNAFFKKELIINDFKIINPTINLKSYGETVNDEKNKVSYQTELYSLISDYLFKINILNLKMENGSINLTRQYKNQAPFEMSNLFSVRMINFQLDSLSSRNKEKLLFSDHIDLILKKQSFSLSDGVHKLDAQEIGIISTENRIYLTNTKVYPDMLSPGFKKIPVAFFANVPSIQLSGTNIIDLVNKGKLPANTIKFINPEIKLLLQKDNLKKNKTSENTLTAIKGIDLITAEEVSIVNGSFELANYENVKSNKFAGTEIDLTLKKLKLENINEKLKITYDDFWCNLNDFNIELEDKIHQLSIGKAGYQLNKKNLSISNLKLTPVKGFKNDGKKDFYKIELPEITMTDFNLNDFINDKKVKSTLLVLNNPKVEINQAPGTKNNEKFTPYKLDLYSKIKEIIEVADINQIKLNNFSIDVKGDKPLSLKKMNIQSTGFLVDKNSDDSGKLLSSESLTFEIRDLKERTKDGFYYYSFEKMNASSKGNISFSGLSLIPAYSAKEFNKRKVYQEDYISIDNADCSIFGIDIKRFFETEEIKLSHAKIDLDNIDIYRNNTYPLPPNFIMDLPQKDLREMKQKFVSDSINITCKRLTYKELTPPATSDLTVYFTDLEAKISNLNNIKRHYSLKPNSDIYIKGKLMGSANMYVDMDMDIASSENKFKVIAECDYIPLSKLNNVIEPGLLVSVKEGYNENLGLYFEAQEDSSEGNIKFAYKDLKISVLSQKEGQLVEDKFISFLANAVAVKADNPPPGRLLFPQKFKAKRDKTQSIVNYMWLNLFAGIKTTLGMKDKPEQAASEQK